MVPQIPQGVKPPIEGSFETLWLLYTTFLRQESTQRMLLCCIYCFFCVCVWIQCIRAALNLGRGERAPLGNVQDAMEKKIKKICAFQSLLSPLCSTHRWLPGDEKITHG